jgi:endonuclease III
MRASKVSAILKLLRGNYGRRGFVKRKDAVGELVKTILSQNTSDRNSFRAYNNLKKRFKDWDVLRRAKATEIKAEIKLAGLANIKAARIKGALEEIKARRGSLSLGFLRGLDTRAGYEFLRSIKGVGPKTAAVVLLFSFGKPLMPVDTHVYRVARRLGILNGKAAREEAQERLSAAVPKDLIYEFHINLISHGREVCAARNPRCGVCNLKRLCEYYKNVIAKSRRIVVAEAI